MTERLDTVVIGGGQAGLSVSHELSGLGIDHVVLERGRVGQAWRGRWDSFCLVTPNWSVLLPGGVYDGADPDGFMPKDDIVAFLEGYAEGFSAPVREAVDVRRLDRDDAGGFTLQTSEGEVVARSVVVASGAYQRPHRPDAAATLPPGAHVIDAESYTNPGALPPGKVLVVGSGQTGCQLAEELHEAGRETFLACGKAPWSPRRIGGRDLVYWVIETPFMDMSLADIPNPMARLVANFQASGHGGGHDLHYRTLQAMGVNLLGHMVGADDGRLRFADDIGESVAFGDARYIEFKNLIEGHCKGLDIPAPEFPDPGPFTAQPPTQLDVGDFGAIIFTSGFRPDYTSWVRVPGAFDNLGFPIHKDCESTVAPGLFFVGVHFLRKRKSSLLMGVGEDATIAAGGVAARSRQ